MRNLTGHQLVSNSIHRDRRQGIAAVEFAVCLPVIILLVFGAIEASSFIFLKQSLHVAAYEGAREAIRVQAGDTDGAKRAKKILEARGVSDFQIRFPNGDPRDAKRGDRVVVEVLAPTAPNSPLAGKFVTNRILRARTVMVKE